MCTYFLKTANILRKNKQTKNTHAAANRKLVVLTETWTCWLEQNCIGR